MDRFEYEITRHDAKNFSQVVYFCSADGDCGMEEVPREEPNALAEMLNERGRQGWELVQLLFGRDGLMACWKRRVESR